jgi:pimeloyl-ACP methyl ester carboxylesterase
MRSSANARSTEDRKNMQNPWKHPIGVPAAKEPRVEGRFHLAGGRRLGYAEFGDPRGRVVLWFHGTPGGRRQMPMVGRRAAERLGLRVVVIERPGSGLSDPYAHESIASVVADMVEVADALGARELATVGLSGGGPYALACGGVAELRDRVRAVAVLGGVVPSVGPDAGPTGMVELTRRFAPLLTSMRRPLAAVVSALVTPLIPLGHLAYQGFSLLMPEGDRQVFADPEIEAMFIDDIVYAMRGGFQAAADDLRLFGRDWGFRLGDVTMPVRWWHGDADPIVPLDAAEAAVARLPDARLILRPKESHLGGFATADEVLETIRELW